MLCLAVWKTSRCSIPQIDAIFFKWSFITRLLYIGSSFPSFAISLYLSRIRMGNSSNGTSNAICVFVLSLLIHALPVSDTTRFSFVNRHISPYDIPVKHENRNRSRTKYRCGVSSGVVISRSSSLRVRYLRFGRGDSDS